MSEIDLKKYNTISMPVAINFLNIDLKLPSNFKDKKSILIKKKILFFGDKHTIMPTFRPKKNEISVPAFLYAIMKTILKSKDKKCIDFWIENYIYRKDSGFKNYYFRNLLQNHTFSDFNKHFYEDYLGFDETKIDTKTRDNCTLQVMRNFFLNCHPDKILKQCAFGDKHLRVHDFDTRFQSFENQDNYVETLLRTIYIGIVVTDTVKEHNINPDVITELMLGIIYFNKKYKTFDEYYKLFILPLYENLKKSFISTYKLEKEFQGFFLNLNKKRFYYDFKVYFNRNTKIFKKVIKHIGKNNATFLYNRLFEFVKYQYTNSNRLPDIYFILRLFSEFDFSTSDKKRRSPCELGRDDGTISPKYNILFLGANHMRYIRNFLIYYSKTISNGGSKADFKLIHMLNSMISLSRFNTKKVVKAKDIHIYDIRNNSIKKYATLKNSNDLLNSFLFDQKNFGRYNQDDSFNQKINEIYDVKKMNITKPYTEIKKIYSHSLRDVFTYYTTSKNEKKNGSYKKNKNTKECPPDKIRNPVTGRCVNKNGKIGRNIIQRLKLSNPKPSKNCPPDKILNPKTGRCVKRNGKIGKEIIKNLNKSPLRKQNYPLGILNGDKILIKQVMKKLNHIFQEPLLDI